jgi:hypothetical protein
MRSSVVLPIGLLVIGSMAVGAAQAQDVTAPKPNSAGQGVAAPSASSSNDRAPSANPLWAIPLRKLTETRDRPLFSPSRRPPPVVVAKAAPPPPPPQPTKPQEPEKLQLALVGTILGAGDEGIGVFLSAANMGSFRLKAGEDHQGWVLRAVRPREVELVKGQQVTVLQLPVHEPGKELGKGPGNELGKPGPLPPPAAASSARLAAPSVAPASVPPAEPSAPPPAPANGVPEAADQVASAAFPPGITSRPKFKMPKPSDTPAMANAAVIQPPVIVPPDPFVNPFQKGWIR